MNFAIDIIWIDEDKKIVDIIHDAKPESYPRTFTSRLPARYVLEVVGGWTEEKIIRTGVGVDFVRIK